MGSSFYERAGWWSLEDSCLFGVSQGPAFRLLSNMTMTSIEVGTLMSTSSEALYQAAKFPGNPELQLAILRLPGHDAKAQARSHDNEIDDDWPRVRRQSMLAALLMKLAASDAAALALAESGDRPIVEVSRTDIFWGTVPTGGSLWGTNLLGRLWMGTRLMSRCMPDVGLAWARGIAPRLWPAAF